MVKVLLFAQFQEAAGRESVEIDAAGHPVSHVKSVLKENYGILELDDANVAVNEEYTNMSTELKDGDTVAFIPPVSGG
ncbi:molybdopterin converting factor subunit 1 [Pontibacillus yanchengensis]|uniref:Molybdopterin converting factor subunit 1 n=2 Tax=Pontibacillus yanchengensis TaxID=462910 RepID=A0ACC7VF45_9BACI|nr:molybdopterin converting factor subunit 1 [Pontibacillus yanchengensis]MYL32251.1 molybdopterin converting factor subunit 1 [Pontibacillus yanchengensis]MYL52831.1 molybdopterin converting factor subunit 1 [Pontibacillus yanchengensis]